jgi:hypothetical protein
LYPAEGRRAPGLGCEVIEEWIYRAAPARRTTSGEEIVAEIIARFAARVHAYCWMTNHIHLLVQIADGADQVLRAARDKRGSSSLRPRRSRHQKIVGIPDSRIEEQNRVSGDRILIRSSRAGRNHSA